jgi:hypothetical protein
MFTSDTSSSREAVIQRHYCHVYRHVYGNEPIIRYVGNQWFQVNGEMVHSRTMLEQIDQLQALGRRKQINTGNKGMVRRLIDKLRLM